MKATHFLTLAMTAVVALTSTSCRSTLYRAAARGDVETVRAELAEGEDPNAKGSAAHLAWRIPATIVAIPLDVLQAGLAIGTLGIYPILMGWESDKTSSPWLTEKIFNFGKLSAMEVATNKEHSDVMTELILAGGNASDWAKIKAVTEASRKGDAETLRKLMEKGCNVKADWNCAGDYKPLMLAIGGGHEECARLLLENGAQFTSTVTIQEQEITCYDYAVAKGQPALYKKLGGTIVASPKSMVGKKIHLDYSAAKSRSRTDISPWEPWKNCSSKDNKTTRTFTRNNTCLNCKYETEIAYWSYKKTGNKTAELDNGIPSESGLGFAGTYYLTFETDHSGTAKYEEGGEGEESETVNIRFTIK